MSINCLRYLWFFVPLLVLSAAILLAYYLGFFFVSVWDTGISFRTIVKKLTQILLVLSIFPAMHYLKLNKTGLGIAPRKIFIKQLWQGVFLGFVTLMPVFVTLYVLDVNVIDGKQPWTLVWISKKLTLELLLALLISFFEEPLFRGVLLIGLSRVFSLNAAILISAFYYAMLHFMDNKTPLAKDELDLFSGFKLLGDAFANLLNPEIASAFLALLAVGVFLGLMRTQAQARLGLCIGCHAGWVWQIKLSKTFFNINPKSDYLFLINNHDSVTGVLVAIWLSLAILVYLGYRRFMAR